jgi:hypothetical protein
MMVIVCATAPLDYLPLLTGGDAKRMIGKLASGVAAISSDRHATGKVDINVEAEGTARVPRTNIRHALNRCATCGLGATGNLLAVTGFKEWWSQGLPGSGREAAEFR